MAAQFGKRLPRYLPDLTSGHVALPGTPLLPKDRNEQV